MEFARAVTDVRLQEPGSPLRYIGFVKEVETDRSAQKDPLLDITSCVRSKIFEHWDQSKDAPPPTRQKTESEKPAAPELGALAWQDDHAIFPDILLTRFPEGTEEHAKIEEKKVAFDTEFPYKDPQPQPATGGGARRVGGYCDFTIDGGKQPLDTERLLELPAVKDADFTEKRLALRSFSQGAQQVLKKKTARFPRLFIHFVSCLAGWPSWR